MRDLPARKRTMHLAQSDDCGADLQGDLHRGARAAGVDMVTRLRFFYWHWRYRILFWYMHNERGQYFAPRVYVLHYPDGRTFLGNQVDWDELPEGTLIAEYRFTPWQKVYKEELHDSL